MATEKNKSMEELQREIAETELKTKQLLLRQAQKSNADFEAAEERRHESNRLRMAELKQGRENHARIVKLCRHRSGGRPQDILKGGGIGSFSVISRVLLPDGVTKVLFCPRCAMIMYPPEKSLAKQDPKKYAEELEEYSRLLAISEEEGLEFAETRGPTFFFTKDGVPFVPERV